MTDIEIMAAIGMEFEFYDERPAMPKVKKSFLQKLTERNGALKLHMRSSRGGDRHDEPRTASRTSSSSSASKDFFKMSRSDRTQNDFALRYDDLEGAGVVSPPTSEPHAPVRQASNEAISLAQPDRKVSQDARMKDLPSLPRLLSSHSATSANSPCTSPLAPPPFSPWISHTVRRARSIPNEMSDEEMDEWLEKPEDAEVHRERKLSEASAKSNASLEKERKTSSFLSDWSLSSDDGPKDHRESWVYSEFLTPAFQMARAAPNGRHLDVSAIPDEVLLEIARRLDMESVVNCRGTCRKLYHTVPAPQRPLAAKKLEP
ncbi:hypothetical protein EK21DRAFT_116353 [Setomelanomma holmii]|uniref:F-box domain-containing protein n=1 Tax=Setomelanomma holmii TaxID=210430 RepID=A0A9P4H131_9PLEO|nr:hypothetical protein EK21DRAFT_116353 [Setomelanomma holmii]